MGDSHTKNSAAELQHTLGSTFAVSSFVKPGAGMRVIVDTVKEEYSPQVAVNQNTPAPEADVLCIITLVTLQKPATNGLLHLLRYKSCRLFTPTHLQHSCTHANKLYDLTG
jgi:hypothetical protein